MSYKSSLRSINSRLKVFTLPHPLANLEIQKYYQNEPKFTIT